MSSIERQRRARRTRRRLTVLAACATTVALTPTLTHAQDDARPGEVPFAPVFEGELAGDLVMAGNSNLLSAGGWRTSGSTAADVDGDGSRLCVVRRYVPAACADNSSSATLDVPAGARIVAARLYVNTTLTPAVGALRARLDGPADGYDYTELVDSPAVPKLFEGAGGGRSRPNLRQAVWDVTDYVGTAGAGVYTVADIVHERAGAWLPYASWAIVAAYELDPASTVVLDTEEARERFARRAVSWYDGFVARADASVDVPVTGFAVLAGQPVFAKSFHIVAHAQAHGADNMTFAGGPVGNNVSPGNGPAPLGVVIGADPACNSTTDIFNDSICVLGTPVETKAPGPTQFRASIDGRTATSGSAVDMDVSRIPERYFLAGTTSATLSVRTTGRGVIAPSMLAVAIDLDPPPVEPPADPAAPPSSVVAP